VPRATFTQQECPEFNDQAEKSPGKVFLRHYVVKVEVVSVKKSIHKYTNKQGCTGVVINKHNGPRWWC